MLAQNQQFSSRLALHSRVHRLIVLRSLDKNILLLVLCVKTEDIQNTAHGIQIPTVRARLFGVFFFCIKIEFNSKLKTRLLILNNINQHTCNRYEIACNTQSKLYL